MTPSPEKITAPRSGLLPFLADYLPLAALMLFFLRACYQHAMTHNLWLDEILSRLFLSDPSLTHMLAANQDVINTTPPLYFILGWLWFHVFSGTELSLRLFTSLLLCASVGVTWRILRPRYGFLPAAIGLYAGFSAPELLTQNSEVRFYTLFLLASAFVLWQYDRLTRDAAKTLPQYALNLLAHSALIFTHSFGFLYSGCVVLSHLLICLRQRQRVDTRFLVSVALSWVIFAVLWGRAFVHHLTAFRPYSWIPRPTFQEAVTNFYVASLWVLAAVAGAVILFVTGRLLSRHHASPTTSAETSGSEGISDESTPNSLHLPLVASVLLAIPVPLVYVVSQIGSSFFLSRYFLPVSIGWAILIAFLWDTALNRFFVPGRIHESPAIKVLNTMVSVGALAFLVVQLMAISRIRAAVDSTPAPVTTAAEADFILAQTGAPESIPVVFTSNHRFNTSFYYAPKPSRYYYLLDKDYVLNSGPGTAYNYVVQMVQKNVAEHYPDQNTREVTAFLNTHPRFIVFDDKVGNNPGEPRWHEYRLAGDSRFMVTPLPVPREISHVFSLFLVEKK